MTATTTILRRALLPLVVLAVLLMGLASTAGAATDEFAFKPGAFAKAHPPVAQEVPGFCPGIFQCGAVDQASWTQAIENTAEETQAGGHPDFTTHFRFETSDATVYSRFLPFGHPRTVVTDAPAGSIGSPLAVPRCEQDDFNLTLYGACPPEAQVGGAVSASSLGGPEDLNFYGPVSSLVPSPGQPGLLGFKVVGFTVNLIPEVRSESDYGLRITADHIPIALSEYTGSTLTLWGVPHDPVHDLQRFNDTGTLGGHIEGTPKPFLSAPTNCSTGPITLTQKARPWEHPEDWIETHSTAAEPTGCDQVPFDPGISAKPTTNVADSPSGLEVDISTPQHEGCEQIEPPPPADQPQFDCGLATSHLKDTTVTLPAGMSINPSSANGLEGCTEAQIGLTTPEGVVPQQFTKAIPTCPESSRIGSVEVDTPLLDAPMPGSIFIAKPYENPFKSLLAIYIVANDEQRGLIVKLAGEVKADPVTGQLTTVVTNAPQLPFSHFLLHFKQGPHATLRTPATCATYTTEAALTPYSQPTTPFDRQGTFAIDQGPSGGCDTPNAPSLDAGSVTPIAGAVTPTVVNLSRPDGSQEFSQVSLTLPPGLTGKLAGVGQCPAAALAAAEAKSGREEQASPSCPANSQIGNVYIAAGSGPAPYNTTAQAYLSTPYKGAPLSMAVIAPAVAGPFDLGTVVVRVALAVNPSTAQIEATSDEFPHILKGIPLDVRSVRMVLDRPDFTRNGTSCDPSAFSGSLTSTLGQSTPLSERFQLAECSSLAFKPKLAIRLFGATKRGDHPALRGVVQMPEGSANIATASVALPHSEFLDQGHIGTVCTRVQFAAGDGNGSACPPASIYGKAIAESPLLDYALTGPAILRSSSHKLPDLVVALHGPPSQPVKADVVGRIDSVNGGIRTTFEAVPDIPVSKFVLSMKGGKKGLLQNSTDICQGTHKATAKITGQNAKTAELAPELRNGKCGAAKRKGKGRGAKGAHR
jgi:hypothetical protein